MMLIIVVMGSLYSLLNRLNTQGAETSKAATTSLALKQAHDALLAFAAMYKERSIDTPLSQVYDNGYLPCPDLAFDDQDPDRIGTSPGNCGAAGTFSIGLLPTRSLGLPELRDGDGNCLWYAVSGTHKENTKAAAAPDGGTIAQLQVYDAAGNLLVSQGGVERGAAAVIIAPGPELADQGRQAVAGKPCATDSTQIAAYLESQGPSFIAGAQRSAAGIVVKNDQVGWLTAREISSLIGKRSDAQTMSLGNEN